MAKIISASLSEEDIIKLDQLTKSGKFSGRSETLRAGIEILREEQKIKEKIKGSISAILLVVHKHSKHTLEISHDYQEIIKSHNHSHLQNDKCIDIFTLEGESENIKKIEEKFRKDKRTSLAKLILI